MAQYCSQADLERAVGGAAQLRQLLDKDGDNVADLDLVNMCLNTASGEIASYLINIDLDTVVEPFTSALVAKTADIAAYYAWRYGGYGNPIPELVKSDRDEAIAWAKDVGKKYATLGEREKPNLEDVVGVIDFDPLGQGISVKGFKRGFR